MTSFVPLGRRDAWAAIRGYVYQVDTTIERWLDLRPDEVLELECGEDIDRVARAIRGSGSDRTRLLEQVKHRERTVTLRSPEARVVLATARQHISNNPDLTLLFRYTTNAQVGNEAGRPLPGGIPGIEAWEYLRTEATLPAPKDELLSSIRVILRDAPKPEGVADDVWGNFQAFLEREDDNELAGFISQFEWSVYRESHGRSGARLREKLVELGLASSAPAADALYHRLFVHAFNVLSREGVKRLTRRDLEVQAAADAVRDEDRLLAKAIHELLELFGGRLDLVETEVSRLSTGLRARLAAEAEALVVGINRMTDEQRMRSSFGYEIPPSLDEPPLVSRLSPREATVDSLVHDAGGSTWIALDGVSGSGKSQLALLLARRMAENRNWVRLRGLEPDQAAQRLLAALHYLTATDMTNGPLSTVLERVVEVLPSDSLLTLDDLPSYSEDDLLGSQLTAIVQAFSGAGIRVLSTSAHPVPSRVRERLRGLIYTNEVPSFSAAATRELLLSFGAPKELRTHQFCAFLVGITDGHPTLLAAACRYLSEREWHVDKATLTSLLHSHYAEKEINPETVRALLQTVEDEPARQLLARLNISSRSHSIDDVKALASVEPSIRAPRERLAQLLGLWIQQEASGGFSVSPLVRALGSFDLDIETARCCHRELAERLISKVRIGVLEFSQAFTHYVCAEDYQSAARVLLQGLMSFRELGQRQQYTPPVLFVWEGQKLPSEIPLDRQFMIRGLQLAVAGQQKRDTRILEADLARLMEKSDQGLPAVVAGANLFASQAFVVNDLPKAAGYLREVVTRWSHIRELAEEPLEGERQPFALASGLVWLTAAAISSAEDLREWVLLLRGMSDEVRAETLSGVEGARGSVHVATTLLLREADETRENRNVDALLAILDELREEAEQMDLELLTAATISAKASVHGELLGDFSRAKTLVEEALHRSSFGPDSVFWLRKTIGLMAYDLGDDDTALTWLDLATRGGSTVFDTESVHAVLRRADMVGRRDPAGAIGVTAAAVELAARSDDHLLIARAYGEQAVAAWLAGDLEKAFFAAQHAGKVLIESKSDGEEWRDLFVVFGHVLGYLTSLAHSGGPPLATEDGFDYTPPFRCVFLNRVAGRADWYEEPKFALVFSQLALFASGVGRHDEAAEWACRGLAAIEDTPLSGIAVALLPLLQGTALREGDYLTTLRTALRVGSLLVATQEAGQAVEDLDTSAPAEILGEPGGDAWLPAEGHAFNHGFLPIVLQLGHMHLTGEIERFGGALESARRALASMSDGSADPDAWTSASALLGEIFDADADELIRMGERQNSRILAATEALRYAAYLGASLRDITPEKAIALHVSGVWFYSKRLAADNPIYEDLLAAFFHEFWSQRIDAARFRFSNPRVVAARLDEATELKGESQVKAIIKAVSESLAGPPPKPELVAWLAT